MKRINRALENLAGIVPQAVSLATVFCCLTLGNGNLFGQDLGGDVILPPNGNRIANTCAPLSSSAKYGRISDYFPDANTPVKTILININIMQKTNGTGNFSGSPDNIAAFQQLVASASEFFANNGSPVCYQDQFTASKTGNKLCSSSDPHFLSDTRIRLELGGIYFYQSDSLQQSFDSQALLAAVKAADPTRLNQLNVFFTEATYTPSPGAAGLATVPDSNNLSQDGWLILFKFYWRAQANNYYDSTGQTVDLLGGDVNGYPRFGLFFGTFVHEIGHNLDLLHTYDNSPTETGIQTDPDYLDDVFGTGSSEIFPQQAGWQCDPTLSSNTCTNNMMGGSMFGGPGLGQAKGPWGPSIGYLSREQIGKMHRALSLKSVRRYVKPCPRSPAPLVISTSETWNFDIKLYSDIVIQPGATLTLNCPVALPGPATVTPPASLIIAGGAVTNDSNCNSCVAPPANLSLWLPFDETGGFTAFDWIGHSNGIVADGTFSPIAGIVTNGLAFDGVDDYTQVTNDSYIDVKGMCSAGTAEDFTIAGWVKTSSVNGTQVLVDKRLSAGNSVVGYHLFIYNDGRFGFQMGNGGTYSTFLAPDPGSGPLYPNVADGNWHLVAVTVGRCSGTLPQPNGGRLLVDGNPVLSFTPVSGSLSNSANLQIGRRDPDPALGGPAYLKGDMDELQLFKRNLAQSEIESIFEAGRFGVCKTILSCNGGGC